MSHGFSFSARRRPLTKDELSKVLWLDLLTPEQSKAIVGHIFMVDYEPGSYVLRIGDKAMYWSGVLEGLLKAAIETKDGDTITYTGLSAGGWFGEGSLIKEESYGYNVQALRKSSVAYVPIKTFQWLINNSYKFCHFIMDLLNERLAQFMNTVETDRTLSPEGRVILTIKRLTNQSLFPLAEDELQITQLELAYLAGLSRQRVNRALKKLQEDGVVSINYGKIKLNEV